MRRADFVIGIGLLLFAGFYFRESFDITVGFAADRLGPKFFPRLLAAALAAAALALIWRSMRGRSDPTPPPPMRVPLFGWTVALTAAYALLLRPLGYPIATALYVGAIARLLGYRSILGLIGAAGGVTLTLYLVFGRALKVLVPMGPLGP